MIKRTLTMFAWAAVAAAPTIVGAQTADTTAVPLTCDCPLGDSRGSLKNLAAFAPLGLLGALAAAGGGPALFTARTPDPVPTNVAVNTADAPTDPTTAITDPARNATEPALPRDPAPEPNVRRGDVPEPVSVDSMRAGIRAPNTATPLPSVFLIGSGLIAVGCVTILRTRG